MTFVGFLYSRLIRGEVPKIFGASLAYYVSGIRLTHADLGFVQLQAVKDNLLLKAACAGYRKATDSEM